MCKSKNIVSYPSDASLSMFGVFIFEPWKPTSLQPRSSASKNNIRGGLLALIARATDKYTANKMETRHGAQSLLEGAILKCQVDIRKSQARVPWVQSRYFRSHAISEVTLFWLIRFLCAVPEVSCAKPNCQRQTLKYWLWLEWMSDVMSYAGR